MTRWARWVCQLVATIALGCVTGSFVIPRDGPWRRP